MSRKNEDFLIQKNDDIDNSIYELLDAVMRNEDTKTIRRKLQKAVNMLLPDTQAKYPVPDSMVDEAIAYAKKQVELYGRLSGARLEWDMFLIGNTFTFLECELEEDEVPVCHPWFDTDNDEIVCCETSDKCAYCPRKN